MFWARMEEENVCHHPYAGIIRIRYKGLISAREKAPLDCNFE
jgi:hypothetical protein